MSLIIHRCTKCEHPDIFHNPRDNSCSHNQCRHGRHVPDWAEPEVLPTWRSDTGEPVEVVVEPGSTFRGFGLVPQELCGCDDCRALWRSVAA